MDKKELEESIDIFTLKAQNSSGEQTLSATKDGDEIWFTIFGDYKGESIQIDFDSLTIKQLENIKTAIELLTESEG